MVMMMMILIGIVVMMMMMMVVSADGAELGKTFVTAQSVGCCGDGDGQDW